MNRLILADKLPENVILTDDPMRVEMLAAHYLDNGRKLSEIRGMRTYGGTYKNVPVAAVACGFGETAARLYLNEAYALGARRFLYLGECVSVAEGFSLGDIIIAEGFSKAFAPRLRAAAGRMNTLLRFARVCTDDCLWLGANPAEGYGLFDFAHNGFYETARALGADAVAVLAVSENINLRMEEGIRQSGLRAMSQLAFEVFV